MSDRTPAPPAAGAGRGAAFLRYAAFIALTDFGVALLLPIGFALVIGTVDEGDGRFLEGVAILVFISLMFAAYLLPVFLAVCAPAWVLARRAARRRGVPNRRAAVLAAIPTALTGAFALGVFQLWSLLATGQVEAEALALFGVPLVAALTVAPLAARAVYRD